MKKHKENIYFVENIVPNYKKDENETNIFSVVLLKASVKSNILNEKDNYNFEIVKASKSQIDNIHEGQYVFYKDNVFENANKTSVAKRNIFFNNLYRGKLIKKQSKQTDIIQVDDDAEIYSYHINVGHGNCSIIVIVENKKTRLWMIDCSNYDFTNNSSYQKNINDCFDHIKNKFKISKISIEYFFLTHPHFDHYSGLDNLINSGKINNNTTFFINVHYSMPNKIYNDILNKIVNLNSNIVEPLALLQNNIEIWYPSTRTIRSMTSTYSGQNVNVVRNPNNASVLYFFKLNNKRILFTGDLETKKWDIIHLCPGFLRYTNYYVISHHGSLNGHVRNICPALRHISNLSYCVHQNSTQILMGRNGAFNGIYSQQVINDFNNLIYSEKDNNGNIKEFVEIEWGTNNIRWY